MNRCKCGRVSDSGYVTATGFDCVPCSQGQQWYQDMQAAPRQNARDTREDARADYFAGLEEDLQE